MKFRFFLALIMCSCFLSITTVAQTKTRLNHIALSVHDLQKSTSFYQNLLSLDTIPEPFHDGRHTWFGIGGVGHLHLIQNAGNIITPDKNTHFCFSVKSVEAFVEKLVKANIPYEDWKGTKGAITVRVDKVKQIYFQDPDGYWIEINDDNS
jgi:lactoylglutathione lyase